MQDVVLLNSAADAAATLQIQKMMKGDPPKSKTYTREQPKQSSFGNAATAVKLMGATLKKLSTRCHHGRYEAQESR